MITNLSLQPNIGKDTEAKLVQVGINSIEELRLIGTEQAFIRLQTLDSGACIQLLYGLAGAIEGIQANQLSRARKQELCEFHRMTKRNL